MTIFLSYSHGDRGFATLLRRKVSSAGLKIETFVDSELIDPGYNFLREARFCLVLYSKQSVLTECVRLSNRLRRFRAISRILIERTWEPDPQAALVFEGFPSERITFDPDIAFRRVSDLIGEAESNTGDGYESLGKRPGGNRSTADPAGQLSDSPSSEFESGSGNDALSLATAKARRSRPAKSLRKILAGSGDDAVSAQSPDVISKRPSLRSILRQKD